MFEDPPDQPIQPSRPGEYLNSPRKVYTFKEFAVAIQAGDVNLAGQVLSQLLSLSAEVGFSAATFFNQKLVNDPGVFAKVMQIRTEIQEGKKNAAMMLIMECFGIDGLNAVTALKNLQKMA